MSAEHPILFNGPMVRAILEGRKTKTRRIVKLNASGRASKGKKNWHCDDPDALLACPYLPGDRLWVRETWCDTRSGGFDKPIHYKADIPNPSEADDIRISHGIPWHPSIHMPRWASRITLEVTGVRIERLQDISDDDAKAEGLMGPHHLSAEWSGGYGWFQRPRCAFRSLWNGINLDAKGWDANPRVWVIDFMMINP